MLQSAPLGSLRNDDDKENAKKTKQQNNNFARASHFFVHFVAVTEGQRREKAAFHVLWRTYVSEGFKEFGSKSARLHLTKYANWNKRDRD